MGLLIPLISVHRLPTAQRLRMDVISQNIANVNTTRTGRNSIQKKDGCLSGKSRRCLSVTCRKKAAGALLEAE